MSNLAYMGQQLKRMSEDFIDLEKSLAQTERERREYESSTDRIPELIAEGKSLRDKYKMSYAVVRSTAGVFHLIAAASGNKKDFIALIL